MASMAEHDASMTIFYYKSSGDIYSYCTGISDMGGFGEHAEDYAQMLDFVVLERDQTAIEFLYKFYIDIETKQLKLKSEFNGISKYL